MLHDIIIACIAATPPTIVALLAFRSTKETKGAVQEVHVLMNSRLSQLIQQTANASFREGQASPAGSSPPIEGLKP